MRTIRTTTISILAVGLLAGSAVGVAAQDEEAAELETPLYYTWTAGDPNPVTDGTFDEDAGEMRGLVMEVPIEASDPRLSGVVYLAASGNVDDSTTGFGALETRSYRAVLDGGEFTGSGTYIQAGDPSVDGPADIVRETMVLTGDGAYEGMVAFVTGDYREDGSGEAVILRVAVPPMPDVPAAAEADAAE